MPPLPTPSVVQDHIVRDTVVESDLFHSYLREKGRAERYLANLQKVEAILTERGMHNRMRKFGPRLTAGPAQ